MPAGDWPTFAAPASFKLSASKMWTWSRVPVGDENGLALRVQRDAERAGAGGNLRDDAMRAVLARDDGKAVAFRVGGVDALAPGRHGDAGGLLADLQRLHHAALRQIDDGERSPRLAR